MSPEPKPADAPVPFVVPPEFTSGGTELQGVIGIDHKFWPQFVELVQRGANLWPDASPEMKSFCDTVTNGKPMQDYFAQANRVPLSRGTATNKPLEK